MIQPLVPAEVDLRDFPFMPIEVARLLSSETWTLGTGDEKAAAVTLWLKSWHEVPAGSLPADERSLEHKSMSKAWKKVRVHVMRGWQLADDGRYYHEVVAEKVLEAWLEKLEHRLGGASGNAARWGADFDPAPIEAQILVAIAMLRALNPESRALTKKRRRAMPKSSHSDDKTSHSDSHSDAYEVAGGIARRPKNVAKEVEVEVEGTRNLKPRFGDVHSPTPRSAVDNPVNGAVENINSSRAKAPKRPPPFRDMQEVDATANTFGMHRRENESDAEWTDRVYTETANRMTQALSQTSRRASH